MTFEIQSSRCTADTTSVAVIVPSELALSDEDRVRMRELAHKLRNDDCNRTKAAG